MSPLDTTLPGAALLEKPYRLAQCAPEEAEPAALAVESGAPAEALAPAEREAAARLKHPKRLREWLAARLAAKRLISWRLGQDGLYLKGPDIAVLNDEDGLPRAELPGGALVGGGRLSLTHCAGRAAAALAEPGGRVGVDMEAVAPRARSFLELMAHDSEWAPWMEGDFAEQTRLWTLKEAVAKLLGVGLSLGFHDVRLVLDGAARRLELHGRAAERAAALGSPAIHLDSWQEEDRIVTVAYAAPRETR